MRLLVASSVFWVCCQANAALIVNVGDTTLLANTPGQAVNIQILSTSPGTDPTNITGVNLNAFLGDGLGVGLEPVFGGGPTADVSDGGVLFSDGAGGTDYVWDALAGSASDTDVAGNEQFQISNFTFNSGEIQPNGTLLTLYVDTTGLVAGTYDLVLTGGGGAGLPATTLVQSGGATFNPTINNGTVTISAAAVPEPGSMLALAGAFAVGGVSQWRRRRRGSAGAVAA